MLNPTRRDAGISTAPPLEWPASLRSPRPGCTCHQCYCEATGTHFAMDSAAGLPDRDGAIARNLRTEEALEAAKRRGKSCEDDESHVAGCMCKSCVQARDAERDRKVKGVVGVMDKLVRLTNKKRAADAQRAWDADLERSRIEGARHRAQVERAFRVGVERAKNRWHGQDTAPREKQPINGYSDLQTKKTLKGEDVGLSAERVFDLELKAARAALESRY